MVRDGRVSKVRLRKDLTRDIKRGHAWLYSHAVDSARASAGDVVEVMDRRGERVIASGIYHPDHALSVRICRTQAPFRLDDQWLIQQLQRAIQRRLAFFDSQTTGYRLVAGEGDGLPGLIVDVYDKTAVIKLDGGAPEAFYQPQAIAAWLGQNLQLTRVVCRPRERGKLGQLVWSSAGDEPEDIHNGPVEFLENGLRFTADVWRGQKTGFFLDQRDNRHLIRRLSADCSVLNLFSFNGGFSIAAGVGGSDRVTSVDIAAPAIEAAENHWMQNELPVSQHEAVVADCFEFLESAVAERRQWKIVICDPPSFAPSEKAIPNAVAAYTRLAHLAARVTSSGGLLALASCSSHIDHANFLQINVEALGRARRKANLIADRGLPVDHPAPLAMPELRYLKFLLLQLD
ncbi:MAG: class I SAM-dependent rRNA methyltransferase [bacterium]|nr:class I SAM-dependent rRNA methyltransferase [bacterium]